MKLFCTTGTDNKFSRVASLSHTLCCAQRAIKQRALPPAPWIQHTKQCSERLDVQKDSQAQHVSFQQNKASAWCTMLCEERKKKSRNCICELLKSKGVFFFPKAACGSPQQKSPANPTCGTNILHPFCTSYPEMVLFKYHAASLH